MIDMTTSGQQEAALCRQDGLTTKPQQQTPLDRSASTTTTSLEEEDLVAFAFMSLKFRPKDFCSKKRQERFNQHYQLGSMIAKGGFGAVFRCTHLASGTERACKLLPKKDKKTNKAAISEFKTMAELDHPNLVKVYELFEDKKYFFIVTDIYEGGDMFDYIQSKGPLNERDAAIVIKRLLCCINYCHQNNLVHRDLKPENLLLDSLDKPNFHNVKLCDMGLARHEKKSKKNRFSSIVGSPFYVSPQVVAGDYGRSCDIWAIGVILYVLLSAKLPFDAPTDREVLEKIQVGWVHFDSAKWDNVSNEATSFIRYLMTFDEEERPTAAQALQHPWLGKHCGNSSNHVASTTALETDVKETLEALQRFTSKDCKLKQATGTLIASHLLTKSDRERIDAIFRVLDRTGAGCISAKDLQLAFADYLGVYKTQQEVAEQILAETNFSGNAAMSYSEFAAVMVLEGPQELCQPKIQAAFASIDTESKGYLTAKDFRGALRLDKATADGVSRKMIAQVTGGKDFVISRDVFERAVASNSVTATEEKQARKQRRRKHNNSLELSVESKTSPEMLLLPTTKTRSSSSGSLRVRRPLRRTSSLVPQAA